MTKCQNLIRIMMVALAAIVTLLPSTALAGPLDWWHKKVEEAEKAKETVETGATVLSHLQTYWDSFGWHDIIGGRTPEGVNLTICLWFGVGALVLFAMSFLVKSRGAMMGTMFLLYIAARVAGFFWELAYTSLLVPDQCKFWYDLVVPGFLLGALPAMGRLLYYGYYWWQRGMLKYVMPWGLFLKTPSMPEARAPEAQITEPANPVISTPEIPAATEPEATQAPEMAPVSPTDAGPQLAPSLVQAVPVVPVTQYTGPRCPSCELPLLRADVHFCNRCGFGLEVATPAQPPDPQPVRAARERSKKRNFLDL